MISVQHWCPFKKEPLFYQVLFCLLFFKAKERKVKFPDQLFGELSFFFFLSLNIFCAVVIGLRVFHIKGKMCHYKFLILLCFSKIFSTSIAVYKHRDSDE